MKTFLVLTLMAGLTACGAGTGKGAINQGDGTLAEHYQAVTKQCGPTSREVAHDWATQVETQYETGASILVGLQPSQEWDCTVGGASCLVYTSQYPPLFRYLIEDNCPGGGVPFPQ